MIEVFIILLDYLPEVDDKSLLVKNTSYFDWKV